MERHRLEYLLRRNQVNACTPEELEELNEWFHSLNFGSDDFRSRVEASGSETQLADELFHDFNARRGITKRMPLRALPYRIAAAVLLFATIGAVLYFNRERPQETVKTKHDTTIKPGGNKAVLTLADGSKLTLDAIQNGQIASQGGIQISKTGNEKLVYSGSGAESATSGELVYNTISIPRGGQFQLQLPDGTKVWLNAASSMRYPVKFENGERRVQLTGEAYFEVAHDPANPFVVASGNQEVQVLGTHFNIKAYDDEPVVSTTLVEGSVRVTSLTSGKSGLLKPGQQASFSRKNASISTAAVNVDEAIAWKSGYFIFDNQDVPTMMKMISRWYDVDIEYGTVSSQERFGGTFSRSSPLQNILSNLEKIGKTHFKIKEKKVVVSN